MATAATLSVQLAGLMFKSPVVVASSECAANLSIFKNWRDRHQKIHIATDMEQSGIGPIVLIVLRNQNDDDKVVRIRRIPTILISRLLDRFW
ncbi:MAG: hypothetical protein QGE94_07025 [Desulfobacterales bacterium]|jgi:hypothetical protein|nr:hypothetical protein [Desulfobacterales bacterium]